MSGLDSLYQEIILEQSKLRNGDDLLTAEPVPAGARSGHSHQLNPVCGDEITVRVDVAEGGDVLGVHWDGAGCAISMASASVLTGELRGLSGGAALELIEQFRTVMRSRGTIEADPGVLGEAAAFSGVSRYAARVKCAMLAWVAVEDALRADSA
ncbi:Fe-S cluster assembly sulfur transfer protein SufU [Psychromicrobium xiongbiense]|uniref:Fe-S cluster assembly sulfur transfer protein SufU n=1 Tax=Psychromicrobium xiongbiense TaxID=3051184 RepID=UPI002557C1A9|nr:SUF system NifU family Fe-S cluster assembly protein [Psychromicrobium sp. YIM S02556]